MLPYLDAKKAAGMILMKHKDQMTPVAMEKNDSMDPGMDAFADDFLRALDSRSKSDLVKAMKSFMSLHSEPDEDDMGDLGPTEGLEDQV